MKIAQLILSLIPILILSGCTDARWDADTSDIAYDGTIHRLDEAVFANGEPISSDSLLNLKARYGDFLDLYLVNIMQVGPAENTMTANLFNRFLTDPTWVELENTIREIHPNLNSESDQLENAFKRYAVFFDETELPMLVAYNSGFNVGVYPAPHYLGIGLEWYSGSDLKIMDRLPPDLFPQYKRDKMAPRYLVPNALKGWLMVHYKSLRSDQDLLSRMVFSGKILYTTQVLLEDVSDGEILNYSPQQMDWCRNQEYQIWKYFLENDLLFSNEAKQVEKMMNDGPFTPGMPRESPGGVGNWIGLQMVKAFMENHPNMALPELLNLKNDKLFLKDYKP